jgi:hypothetical protein
MKPSRVAATIALALVGIITIVVATVLLVSDWDLHDELQIAWTDES